MYNVQSSGSMYFSCLRKTVTKFKLIWPNSKCGWYYAAACCGGMIFLMVLLDDDDECDEHEMLEMQRLKLEKKWWPDFVQWDLLLWLRLLRKIASSTIILVIVLEMIVRVVSPPSPKWFSENGYILRATGLAPLQLVVDISPSSNGWETISHCCCTIMY